MADSNDFNRETLPQDRQNRPDQSFFDQKTGVINSPQVTPEGKPTRRAIKNAGQAKDVIQQIMEGCRKFQTVNSRILAKYNAERPYQMAKLEQEGLGWRSNFTTKPHAMMIEKVYPRFTELINGLKYLTDSALSSKWDGATEKTELFREKFTKLVRARAGWTTMLDDIALDNSLFGHTVVACLDEYGWFPKQFRQDEIFLSDGCKQDARFAQLAVLRENFLPHELFEQISDREAAASVGWDIENTIAEINGASPTQLREFLTNSGTTETWYQNAERELNVGSSYQTGASVVQTYSLLVREVTGKVSHYRLGGPSMSVLFECDDRFDSMEECLSFFSFQKGNGTMRGSKGVGRDIYELAGMIDRIRNEIVDRAILSGKTIFQGDPKRIHTFKMSIIGATCIVPAGWTVLEQKIDGNIEPFLKLDAYVQTLVDQLVGSVSAPNVEGEAYRSPEAWKLLASRQEEQRDSKLTRFLQQFVKTIQMMQTRACREDVEDEDAIAFQKELLETMTREELDEIAAQPVVSAVRDLTPADRQTIVQIAAEKKGHPLYNQRQLEVEDVTARVGTAFAKKIILPENDPTIQAEQTRLQQMEMALITAGQPVPVSPRDNHLIHLQILMPFAESIAQAIQQGQAGTASFEATIAHMQEHYNQAQQQGAPKEALKPVADLLAKAGPALEQMKQMDAKAETISQDSAKLQEDAVQQETELAGQMPA